MLDIFENIPDDLSIEFQLLNNRFYDIKSLGFNTVLIRENNVEIVHVVETDIVRRSGRYKQVVHLKYSVSVGMGGDYIMYINKIIHLNHNKKGIVLSYTNIDATYTYTNFNNAIIKMIDITNDSSRLADKTSTYLNVKSFEEC